MDIHKFLSEDVEVILVNDASTETDCDGGVAFWQQADTRQKVRYIKNKKNLGFGGSMNRGAKVADGEILVFLSNDVVITNNFAGQIERIIENEENVLIGGRIVYWVYWDSGWNKFNNTIFPYCEGWLLACTKEVWDNLGGFDPRYRPYDYEDVDLSTTAISKGYKLVGLDSPHLNHIGGATAKYNEKRLAITHRNKELFAEKWKDLIAGGNNA
jgi:GT2 family glycosyltransferase